MKIVYEYKRYKPYLLNVLGAGKARSGLRARLAEHLGCQTAHVSQVLNGHTHFSVEQAFKINSFLGHDSEEAHFFILLLNKDRAGTTELEQYYRAQLDEILVRRSFIKSRVNANSAVPPEHQTRYYGTWQYVAIHMALSIPALQTKEALARYFGLPLAAVAEALNFLIQTGLAAVQDGRHRIGPAHVHLGHDSDNIQKHHMNWRVQAMESLSRSNPADLHYSVVYSLSREDAGRLKARVLELIEANLRDVGPSKEEVLFCSCLDFFELKKE